MRREPFLQTASGRRVNPLALRPDDVDIGDIAKALSNQCRFGGHCRVFYSVAQHSCTAADLVREREGSDAALWALLHDAPEAYLGDLPHPLKHFSELGRSFRDAEARIQGAICERFGLPQDPPVSLKEVDRALLAAERSALMLPAWEWPELAGVAPAEIEIDPWSPERSEQEFLDRFSALSS